LLIFVSLGVPSGGDWALERLAAITFEYAENCVVESSMFTKLDGNAIAINGYNRGHLIQDNEFVWIGNNAVTSWGYTDYWNATSLLQPYNTSLLFNFCLTSHNIILSFLVIDAIFLLIYRPRDWTLREAGFVLVSSQVGAEYFGWKHWLQHASRGGSLCQGVFDSRQ
jgi:hypothetical protein